MSLEIVILAAGQGTRMKSALPKVLHQLAGTPLLAHVINTAKQLNPTAIHLIYGHGAELVKSYFSHLQLNWVEQTQQLGTGHAVAQALPFINAESQILVLYGDVPLISSATLKKLLDNAPKNGVGLITAEFADPTGLGRIIRNSQGEILGIVEQRDTTPEQAKISEIFSGILTAPAKLLQRYLPTLKNDNAQGEYYLTDVVKLAVQHKLQVTSVLASCRQEVEGVNDRYQLAKLERYYQHQAARKLMLQGVKLIDAERFDLRGELEVGQDVTIDINVIIAGKVSIGNNSVIGSNVVLNNVRIGENVTVKPNCVIEDSVIENDSVVGPFAHLRPGTHLKSKAKVGNFVEIKKSTIGSGSKVNHLSYIGDTEMGQQVNVGAGTITCNYDGVNKSVTHIGNQVFIGSNTSLVAPITIHEGSTIGAGSTITENTPAQKLTLARAKQVTIENWQRPVKEEK